MSGVGFYRDVVDFRGSGKGFGEFDFGDVVLVYRKVFRLGCG